MATSVFKRQKLGTRQSISVPFTATDDGIILVFCRPSSTNSTYADYSIEGETRYGCRVNTYNGGNNTGVAFVRAGDVFSANAVSDGQSINLTFIPINWGGVLNLITHLLPQRATAVEGWCAA